MKDNKGKNIKMIRKYSPLTETTFYILISLLEPLHGYGIMQKVNKLSSGRIKLGPGTLYGALNNLLKADMIEPLYSTDSRRKDYRITDFGIEMVKYEIKRLEEMLENGSDLMKRRTK